MLTRTSPGGTPGEAILEYLSADFRVIRTGNFVRCAVTGEAIALEDLRYWSVSRQEPYLDPAAVVRRRLQTGER